MDKNVPEIRFKGFKEAWNNSMAADIADYTKGKGYSKNDLTKKGTPIILYGSLYTNYQFEISEINTFATSKKESIYSQGNEVIIPASGETSEDIARASAVLTSGVLLGGDLNIIKPFNFINSSFLALTVSNGKAQKELSRNAQGKTVVHIHNEDIQKLSISYPSKPEQVQIVSIFRNVEALITLQQRELDKLTTLKKSCLEKMFPKDGSLVPEVRFDGFTATWEQRKLGDLSKRVIVGLASSVTPYYRESGIPILRNLNIKENYLDDTDILYLEESYAESQVGKQIHTDDVLTVHTGYIGISCVVPEKYDGCLTFTTLITTTNKDVLHGKYLSQYLNSEAGLRAVKMVTTQGGRQNLNSNDFVKVLIPYPSVKEQELISSFLNNLDSLITLHHQKLEKLKNLKKACLDKMFA